HHFVPSRENGGAGPFENAQMMPANLARQRHLGISQASARCEQLLARTRFLGARDDALASRRRAAQHDPLTVDGDVLDHYHGIATCRDSRSGHDLHALAGTNYAIETAASLDFANAAQRGPG